MGIKLGYKGGNLVVTRFERSRGEMGPAESSGLLQPGDILVRVNGVIVRGFLFNQIITMVRTNQVLCLDFVRAVEPGLLNMLSNHPVPPGDRKRLRKVPFSDGITRIFKAIDTSGDGLLSKEELDDTPFSKLQDNQLMKAMDSDGDGNISLREWTAGWEKMQDEFGSGKTNDLIVHILHHCAIDVDDVLTEEPASAADEETPETSMKKSIENIMTLKALAAETTSTWSFFGDSAGKTSAANQKRLERMKEADRVSKLTNMFDLWDFDGNGFLDLLEIKPVVYHLKETMYPHDYPRRPILTEDVENKTAYEGIDTDPLVTKREFPGFFLQLCDDSELEKFDETLSYLKRSLVLVCNTLVADNAFKRLSPLHKPLDLDFVEACLRKHVALDEEDGEQAAAVSAMKLKLENIPPSLDREDFKSYLVRQLGSDRTLPNVFERIVTEMVDAATDEMANGQIEALFAAWDFDGSGAIEHGEIDEVLDRLDNVYDMLYDDRNWENGGEQGDKEQDEAQGAGGGVPKTKMRRASRAAIKAVSEGTGSVLSKENFKEYIKKLSSGFGEGGLNNFLHFMGRTVKDVRSLKDVMECLKGGALKKRETDKAFFDRFNGSLPSELRFDSVQIEEVLSQNDLIRRSTDGSEDGFVREIADRVLILIEKFEDANKTVCIRTLQKMTKGGVRRSSDVNPTVAGEDNGAVNAPAKAGCCIVQ